MSGEVGGVCYGLCLSMKVSINSCPDQLHGMEECGSNISKRNVWDLMICEEFNGITHVFSVSLFGIGCNKDCKTT